ncbi:MAG: hypothetical protein A2096_10725 [Spirochaetes bacterium GWF1_41_5]|nr:MAG: hypothetical protein A2096_10725 [Spirochaetes bacterium GWF1_41_5]
MPEFENIKISKVNFEDTSFVFRHSTDIDNLVNSIKFEGLIHPVVLCRKENSLVIVSGYLRMLACRELKKTEVYAAVYDENELSRAELLKIAIAENTKREPLKPVEIADALQRIQQEFELSSEELAAQFGEAFGIGSDTKNVEKYLRLNLLDRKTKDFIAAGAAKDVEFEIAAVENEDDRREIVNFVKHHADIRKSDLKNIINHASKIKAESSKPFTDILNRNELKGVLGRDDMPARQKYGEVQTELEKWADPDLYAKKLRFNELCSVLNERLESLNPDIRSRVLVKKNKFSQPDLSVSISVKTVKQLVDILKVLYEERHSVFKEIMDL